MGTMRNTKLWVTHKYKWQISNGCYVMTALLLEVGSVALWTLGSMKGNTQRTEMQQHTASLVDTMNAGM